MDSFVPVSRSLADMLGKEYVDSVCGARAFWDGSDAAAHRELAARRIDFYPAALQRRLTGLLDQVGRQVVASPLRHSPAGAGTVKFNEATKTAAAPLSGYGYYRIGEDGRLYLVTKSEHYHAPLGHSFPGYRLIDHARALGVPNATHNNTRGYITRRLEEELIRTANGLSPEDRAGLQSVLERTDDLRVLNRVLNLETGSLAVEAALKMILARFYRMQPDMPAPKYAGRIPVILVVGNEDGALQANYHGTTILTQTLRGMWPEFYQAMEREGLFKIVPVRPNCREDVDRAFDEYEKGRTKIAGFFHEIIMMNYGGRRLTRDFLSHAHRLCDRHDVPTVVDEIQSCMWASGLYLFRQYDLRPTFVAVGKGFPGGEYPASRILFSAAMDVMPQFGALVTNGQEELASLSYLVTMAWAEANGEVTEALGRYCEEEIARFASEHPEAISGVDGWGHMTTLCFRDLTLAKRFASTLNGRGLDISAQTYKADCPPVVLLKLPLIADRPMIDYVIACMNAAMKELAVAQKA